MATSDGESCSAEDRALEAWGNSPTDGDVLRALWPALGKAFRAGFRAGQDHPKPSLLERQGAAAGSQLGIELSKIRDRLNGLEGDVKHAVEEEGLLYRIEALEERTVEMLSSDAQADLESRVSDIEERERGTLVRFEKHGQRIGVLEACLKSGGCWAHLPFPDADAHMDERQRECFAQMQEAKLRLLEPIGARPLDQLEARTGEYAGRSG
jgi:hypothetical protein